MRAFGIHGASRNPVVTLAQEEYGVQEVGFVCIQLQAAAALLIGDAVYVDANGKAAKSATDANYLSFAGIVVGGKTTKMRTYLDSDYIGAAAASTDEPVILAITGIAFAVAGGAITRGAQVGISGTSGRVDDAGVNKFGVCLTTATTTGDVVKLLLTR